MTKERKTQYTVPVKNEAASMQRVAETLAKAGVNITGIMTETSGEVAFLRFLADKEDNAVRRPLEQAGFEVFEHPCFKVELANQPGEFSRLNAALAAEEIRVLAMYGTANGAETAKVVVSVDQPDRAAPILARLSEKAYIPA